LAFTSASQFSGRGTGHSDKSRSAVGVILQDKLQYGQNSARATSPASRALRSTYRH